MTAPWLIAALVAATASATPAAPVRWGELSPELRAQKVRALSPRPLPERLLEVSRAFLETPYVVSPLGEGEGVDPDPDERYDAVDCLTFVEQTMAMSVATSPRDVRRVLQDIRYFGRRRYEERNHLMEAQWLPANVKKGYVRDVTGRHGGADVVPAEKLLTGLTWTSPSSMALGLAKEHQPQGRFPFTIIPLEKVMAHAREIPSGTLLLVVREEKLVKATRITHLGFVVQKKKRTYLRHAARNLFGRVVDEDLESFLLRNARYNKWKVSGVALYEVQAPPRVVPVVEATDPAVDPVATGTGE